MNSYICRGLRLLILVILLLVSPGANHLTAASGDRVAGLASGSAYPVRDGISGGGLPATAAAKPLVAQRQSPTPIYVLTFSGAVTPVLERYIQQGIDAALAEGAGAVVLQLDTPGGSVQVTKSITQLMLASPVPIAVYVAPDGANAGSAGTFITLAGHVAAMSPNSSIGAASPVGSGGEDIGETMGAKVENILSADIENLAARRGEVATEWAIAAVRDAKAATAEQALELGVIDYIAVDVRDLLEQMDGATVTVRGSEETLTTAGALQVPLELSTLQLFLNFITDPTIASILLSLGVLGLIAEIRSPGFGVPGIFGTICLLLAMYALGQLDANFTGLALIGIAVALFVAEAFTPAFGLLAFGGMLAFILGTVLLFNSSEFDVPWPTVIGTALALGGFAMFAGGKALAAQRRPVATGGEALIGMSATVRSAFAAGETGSVFVAGEWWNADLKSGAVDAGERVTVLDRRGYTLLVEPRSHP